MINSVTVRDLRESDVPHVLNYWFHSPAGFVESMGVDMSKLPTKAEMESSLVSKIHANRNLSESKLNAVVILLNDQPIGFHTLFPFTEGEWGIFHAHIWNTQHRGKGVALKSYPIACKVFAERFKLQKIVFKTPLQNTAAIRVKEKLGIRFTGEELIDFSIIKSNTRAKVFEVTTTELEKLPT